jgi:hypothetical protein
MLNGSSQKFKQADLIKFNTFLSCHKKVFKKSQDKKMLPHTIKRTLAFLSGQRTWASKGPVENTVK